MSSKHPQKRPNFLFIMTDQQRADHLGCYGNSIVKTPNIDKIASKGTAWNHFYVANPICMPNRASIMTGRLSSLHGARHNGIPLSKDHNTFVELLRDAGYNTGLIGKSHLQPFTGLPATNKYEPQAGLHTPSDGLRDAIKSNRHTSDYELEIAPKWDTPLASRIDDHYYGFDHVELAASHGDLSSGDYLLWAREQRADFDSLVGPENAAPHNGTTGPQIWKTNVPEDLYATNWIADRSEDWLETQLDAEEPFFLQMSFPDPHHPFTPPGKYWDMYDEEEMPLPASFHANDLPPIQAMIKAMQDGSDPRDNQNPFAVTEAEAKKIIALTYGMITMIDDAVGRVIERLETLGLADNTIVVFTSDHGDYMGDHGLMLKLLLHYQGLIKVPFIWHDPTRPDAAMHNNDLASSIDISATILARAGIQPFNGIQGRDLFNSKAPEAVIVEEDSQRTMIGFERPQRIRTIVTKEARMSLRQGEEWDELYDLTTDPDECKNIYDEPTAAPLREKMTDLMLRTTIAMQDNAPLPAYRA